MNPRTQKTFSLAAAGRGFTAALSCALVLTLGACDEDHGNASGHDHSDFEFVVWPESGSTVFSNTAMYIGSPAKLDHVHGQVALIIDGDEPAVGSAMPDGLKMLPKGKVYGVVSLPEGKHTIHVVLFDEKGKASENRQTVEYTVEATPADLGVQWLEPADGATVDQKFKVRFGVMGVGISPAGQNPYDKTVGHHHVTINKGSVIPGLMVPAGDGEFVHYGKGQVEADLELPAGEHELTLQFADAGHRSYGPVLSKTIKVTVK